MERGGRGGVETDRESYLAFGVLRQISRYCYLKAIEREREDFVGEGAKHRNIVSGP